ncbi:S8 family peptidase [Cytobacillus dafuensis]|uniref:S8 family serine peptidase n=1 Tax=Cytobacillus dafuensis TaxID=1742359 RepID=A0A5B8Z4L2_CYTDA|nr:S8 family serine peptidase [Cytobacillus dafuensis]QED48044.1 S8 family serine peptidase [Cytobacillus dafuensis]
MKMKRLVGSVMLGAALVMGTITPSMSAQTIEPDSLKAVEKIRVHIQVEEKNKAQLQKVYQISTHRDFKEEGFTSEVTEKQYDALLHNKNITIEKVPEYEIQVVQDNNNVAAVPSTQVPWGIKAIYNDSSLQKSSGGDGIKVAVLDTGANTSHVDLQANVEQCKDFTRTSTYVNNSCTDKNGHGTHVSGTVLANGGNNGQGVYGVAPEAELWAYKVLNDRGSGYSDDIAYAIRHAADEGTRTGSKVIISMSLGSSSKDSLIANAVTYANNQGALVIAAAGNSGPNANTIGYPGALVDAVAVAALENVQQNGTYRVADFSSRGYQYSAGDYVIQERDVEVAAPGASVESTWYNGGYRTISGTSMATPHVSGLAAKIWSSNKGLTNSQLRTDLQNRAKLYDINGGIGASTGDDYASGFGFPRVR